MKANNVYVGINGATLAMNGGDNAIAAYPGRKGENISYFLLQSGRIVSFNGARIQGVGVARFLSNNGFVIAEANDVRVSQLTDYLDIQEGRTLVEKALQARASELQQHFAGKTCTFVPFAEDKAAVEVQVTEPQGYVTVVMDLASGLSGGSVHIKPTSSLFTLSLAAGWLVGPNGDATVMPRNTEYGGVVEQAVYVICNSGLASLSGRVNLSMDNADEQYPRGVLSMSIPNGDVLKVGINALDEMEVLYCRWTDNQQGKVIYSRTGIPALKLGAVVGAIAAVLVHVAEMDAVQVKKPRGKKAA